MAEALGDTTDLVVALRAAGLAAKELGFLEDGIAHLEQALSLAGPSVYAVAQIRMNLVGLLAARGETSRALAEARRAQGILQGADAHRLAANTVCALARAGRIADADSLAASTLPRLRVGDDPVALAGMLSNLGLARALRGELNEAERLLNEARATSEKHRLGLQTAMAHANLAFVASRRGDIPKALRLYAKAEPGLSGERAAQCRFDRAETLIYAGLPNEARELLETAVSEVEANGYKCDLADGLLLLAHAQLGAGAPEDAVITAGTAADVFTRQERLGWLPLTEHLLLRARWETGERSAVLLGTAMATSDRLANAGWAEASAEARIIAARLALHLGRPAEHLLASVARARAHGPAALRVVAWHATALERQARGDLRGALAAVWSGLSVLADHADAFAAHDLRARAARLGADLSCLALRLSRSARELLHADERRRALARRPVAIRPPKDPRRAAALAELRFLSSAHALATSRGEAAMALTERMAELESSIRAGAHSLSPSSSRTEPDVPRLYELSKALGERALLQFVRIDDALWAVTIADGRPQRHCLGSYAQAAQQVELIHAALRNLSDDEQHDDALHSLAQSTCRLDEQLIAPLAIPASEVVIAPTGSLHALPWNVLPSLYGRPCSVVPSATAWLRAHTIPEQATTWRVLLVAGPGLVHAEQETRVLRRVHPSAFALDGPRARVETVRHAMDGATLVHMATHGEFRVDNPMFSRLLLADGPLTVHDLEELSAAPRTVVLSACDVGRGGADDAVIGMVGVLLALGTRTVVASPVPLRDAASPPFMADLHALLAAGTSPSRALAALPRSPGLLGLTCYGAG
ncbi:CHAT domain-containing protein [Actinomadura rupiterrae]|uniref:CHAT domain-containing protein n=1 Tax=Actinomadura rupiterrae TaxID=559627 RepID=UPI0020A462FE|nr:CHAT domain-containing tetratricopeptide repeat protein [Actinomadura rupiterrae]MCP2335711.1 tetratricopeptide (TPR) repeat protein [Actinomadura rupiterrae]